MTSSMPLPSSLLLNVIAGLSCHLGFIAMPKEGTNFREMGKERSEREKEKKQEKGEKKKAGSWRRRRRR